MLGVVILLLMMATAFMGYVLPWGQMSFWGATVITNLFSAIPVVGNEIVTWLWGGFSVDNPTLEPLLLAALPAALRHPRRGRAAPRGAASARLEQPARHRPQGAAGLDPVPSLLHDQGHVRPRRVPDHLLHLRLLSRRTSLGDPAELHPRQSAGRRRRRSCRNGTSCRSTRCCARCRHPLHQASSPASSPMFGSILLLFVLPWLDTSPVRSATLPPDLQVGLLAAADRRCSSSAGSARTGRKAGRSSSAASRRSTTSSTS